MAFPQTSYSISRNRKQPAVIWAQGYMQDSPFMTCKTKYVQKNAKIHHNSTLIMPVIFTTSTQSMAFSTFTVAAQNAA